MAEAPPELDTMATDTDAAPEPPAEAAPEPSAEAAPEPSDDVAPDAGEDAAPDVDIAGDGLATPIISTDDFTPEISFPGEPVVINERFEVFPAKPLPEMDSPSARAFEAEDRLQTENPVFALVCMPEIPARQNVINSIAGDDLQGIIKLHDAGTVEWTSLNRWCQVLILERPLGGRVTDALASDMEEFQKADIVREVLQQGMEALQYLQIRGHVHRALRPDNLFFRDAEKENIILGEFMSAPPGFDQPLAFETPERAMASPGGRGRGAFSDDNYALGATVAFLLQPSNPVAGLTAEQIIHSKITRSSYQTLVGADLLTATLVEPLRGLLEDNAHQRWDFDSFEMWVSGRRVPAAQSPARQRSPRALKFGPFEHTEPRSLAYAMSLRADTSIKLVRDGTLETWLARGIEDQELAEMVTGAIAESGVKHAENRDADAILMAHILLIMDPTSPVQYKGAHFMADGFGSALATETIRGGNVKDLAEAVVHQLPTKSFELQVGGLAASITEDQLFQELRLHLQRAEPGYGVERCLYLSNPSLPCRSPLLGGRYIDHIEDILPALNEAEADAEAKQRPYDRHLAAFLASHFSGDLDGFLDEADDPDDAAAVLAILKMYARVQAVLQLPEMVGLAKWLGGLVGPVIRQYKSRATRRLLEAEVPKLVHIGWLADLLALMNNTDARLRDASDYADAQDAFREADAEIERIEVNSDPDSDAVQRGSKQTAAVLSIIIMCILVTMMILTN
jgi:hypothetical protein